MAAAMSAVMPLALGRSTHEPKSIASEAPARSRSITAVMTSLYLGVLPGRGGAAAAAPVDGGVLRVMARRFFAFGFSFGDGATSGEVPGLAAGAGTAFCGAGSLVAVAATGAGLAGAGSLATAAGASRTTRARNMIPVSARQGRNRIQKPPS